MFTRPLAFVLFLLALSVHPAAVLAQHNYVTGSVVYTDDDADRRVDDAISGGQISFGRFLSENIGVEAMLGSSSLSGADKLDLNEFGLNVRWALRPNKALSPYLLVGLGVLDVESDLFPGGTTSTRTLGGGLDWAFGDSPWSLQLEYRARASNESNGDLTDKIASLGLNYAFGKKSAPKAVPVTDPDTDGDGIPDSRDACPNTPAGYKVDSQGCALDSDGDGVADAIDECANTYRGAEVDARGCELDDDNDGVVNRLDDCPDTAAGVRVDVNGCEIRDVIELPGVNFETNSDRLLPSADGVLRDAAATLQKYPDLVVEVAGHTDSVGAADYNQGLSERRAYTVRDYLITAGAGAGNLSARGYGEAAPVADNATAEGRAENRRVELRIIEE